MLLLNIINNRIRQQVSDRFTHLYSIPYHTRGNINGRYVNIKNRVVRLVTVCWSFDPNKLNKINEYINIMPFWQVFNHIGTNYKEKLMIGIFSVKYFHCVNCI